MRMWAALSMQIIGKSLHESYKNTGDDAGGFKLVRRLDCLVINNLVRSAAEEGNQFDTVCGYFQEGKDAYPGAGVKEKSHTQICVLNNDCIKGYFLPRAVMMDSVL